MWRFCFGMSIVSIVLAAGAPWVLRSIRGKEQQRLKLFNSLFGGVFFAAIFMFFPIHHEAVGALGLIRTILLSLFNSMQIFTIGTEFEVVSAGLSSCPVEIGPWYQVWASILFVLAPIFTFGFVLSFFKNVSAYLQYLRAYFKDAFVFSELSEKSLALAVDLRRQHADAVIVFADVFEEDDERSYELVSRARTMRAVCLKKDLLAVDFRKHSSRKDITFFAIGEDESENVDQALSLITTYRERDRTHIYVFSTMVQGDLVLTAVDKGCVKVRRINEVRSLVNRILYEEGDSLFRGARDQGTGEKEICAVVVGLGRHGVEMLKSLAWFCQMDGYRVKLHAFDRDPAAEARFAASAPELMSPEYNGVEIPGEARYEITIHPGMDVETVDFVREISKLTETTYVLVALGDDHANIRTAVDLRMRFERVGVHPQIQSIVYNTNWKRALAGIRNYGKQPYDIQFIGDLEQSYTEAVIMDSELEADALRRHLKWGDEDEFWTYEYNYRSSIASAIHMKARKMCGIPGAEKRGEELTEEEQLVIEALEHRRWNAYMRSEGYIFSGSTDPSSRNDLAKMHHDLVDYATLAEEEKRKDSRIGTD